MNIKLTAGRPLNEVEEAFLNRMEGTLNNALANLEVNLGVFGTHITYMGVDDKGELIVEDRTKEMLNETLPPR